MDPFKINFGNLKVDQLGFIYRDIENRARIMEEIFGFSKFIFGKPATYTFQYRGKESIVTIQIAFSGLGNAQFELIKWINGDSVYKEFLDQGKEGLHHIAVYIEDTDSYLKKFEKNGIGILQPGTMFNTKYTFIDTEKEFGIIIELLEKIRRRKSKK